MLVTRTVLSAKVRSPNASSRNRNACIWSACGWRPGVGTVTRLTARPPRSSARVTESASSRMKPSSSGCAATIRNCADSSAPGPRRRESSPTNAGTMCSIHAGGRPGACTVPATRSRVSAPSAVRSVRLSPTCTPATRSAVRSSSTSPGPGGQAPESRVNRSNCCASKSRTTQAMAGTYSSAPTRARATITGRASAAATPGRRRTRSTSASSMASSVSVADAGRVRPYMLVSSGRSSAYAYSMTPIWNTPAASASTARHERPGRWSRSRTVLR
jgi:hypothetical protein